MDAEGGPVDDVGRPLPESRRNPIVYYGQLIKESLSAAAQAGRLGPLERATVERVLESLQNITFSPPVPTSWDYTPSNWIVDEHGELVGVIDFENMAWGVRADPFVRLVVDYFPDSPECECAFCDGYGGEPQREHAEQLHIGCVLYGLYYTTLAGKTGDPTCIERARRAFAACSM
jgi:hypothetical protein